MCVSGAGGRGRTGGESACVSREEAWDRVDGGTGGRGGKGEGGGHTHRGRGAVCHGYIEPRGEGHPRMLLNGLKAAPISLLNPRPAPTRSHHLRQHLMLRQQYSSWHSCKAMPKGCLMFYCCTAVTRLCCKLRAWSLHSNTVTQDTCSNCEVDGRT